MCIRDRCVADLERLSTAGGLAAQTVAAEGPDQTENLGLDDKDDLRKARADGVVDGVFHQHLTVRADAEMCIRDSYMLIQNQKKRPAVPGTFQLVRGQLESDEDVVGTSPLITCWIIFLAVLTLEESLIITHALSPRA